MEFWFVVVITIGLTALIKPLLGLLFSPSSRAKLPPGPPTISIVGNILWRITYFIDFMPLMSSLHAKYGPMLTLSIGSHPAIFISSRSLVHQALIQSGAAFADRPFIPLSSKLLTSNIISSSYGPKWWVFRRNLAAGILHPARVRSYSETRKRILNILLDRLRAAGPATPVQMMEHFHYMLFYLQVLLCFGDRLEERQIWEVAAVQRGFLLSIKRFGIILNFWPRTGRVLFPWRWREFREAWQNLENVFVRLIRARSEARGKFEEENINRENENGNGKHVVCYVDTLLDLELPLEEGKQKLTEADMADLCSEFLNAGADTTAIAFEWIMANIVKNPEVQDTLYEEITAILGPRAAAVEEDDLPKLSYLKAVVLEGLRRHPPGQFLPPHAVTEDTKLGGFLIPKNASVIFNAAQTGWDPSAWEEPMAFRPERFLPFLRKGDGSGEGAKGFDITGSREIKMLPFGAGRRMCPGYALALLHLEYFVANLVWAFEWKAVKGDDIDISERQEFVAVVMKNPLKAIVSPRLK